ncbi:hypothetical protein F5Y16DRAFT_397458 [Xylariaceae sp. FL0255]|nr:hypothetical protein F5Y16DRAFT_397458 [Xylariaceae sp. FL0255]
MAHLQDQSVKRMVIKRPLTEQYGGIQNEARVLLALRNNLHISRILAWRFQQQAPIAASMAREAPPAAPSPPGYQDNFLTGLFGPVIAMEYLENGTLRGLRHRLEEGDIRAPNRVLWSIYLCLVRGCVAMAYPKPAAANGEPTLEEIPAPETGKLGIQHRDLHLGNVMFGSTDPDVNEHNLIPIVKFIDFGRSAGLQEDNALYEDDGRDDEATGDNLLRIARIMNILITLDDIYANVRYENIITKARLLGDNIKHPRRTDLDGQIREIVCRSLAEEAAERPGLADMLARTKAGAAKPPRSYRFGARREMDAAIREFVQRNIYDAAENAPLFGGASASDAFPAPAELPEIPNLSPLRIS